MNKNKAITAIGTALENERISLKVFIDKLPEDVEISFFEGVIYTAYQEGKKECMKVKRVNFVVEGKK